MLSNQQAVIERWRRFMKTGAVNTVIIPRVRIRIAGIAVLCVQIFLISWLVTTDSAHATEVSSNPEATEAMAYRFRTTRDPGLLAEQVFAAALYQQGVESKDIVRRTLAKRREWQILRSTVTSGRWSANEKGKTLVRALGRLASHLARGGSTGVEVADLAILYYEDWMRGKEVSRSAQRLAEIYSEHKWRLMNSEHTIYKHSTDIYQTSLDYRPTWDTLFLAQYGYTPNATGTEIMESDPNFAQHEQIGEILNTANDSNVLLVPSSWDTRTYSWIQRWDVETHK